MEKRQALYDSYWRLFTDHAVAGDGKAVLDDMKMRGFYTTSLFFAEGKENRSLRDVREGQRNFVMEIEKFIELGRRGAKPPSQAQAISNTAEATDVEA